MLRLLYSLGIALYFLVARIYALFNRKAEAFVRGRDQLWSDIDGIEEGVPVFWFHCASVGEFEQVRPVMEGLHQRHPGHFFLLTFYSPSGYEARKDYGLADLVTYLPPDLPWHVKRFLRTVKPALAVFVKYEFWFNMLRQIRNYGIPAILVSGIFRPGQHFFRFYGGWQRSHLRSFRHLFVQDDLSADLLRKYGLTDVSVSGDTRFDRVMALRRTEPLEGILDHITGNGMLVVAGSTWPEDERMLAGLMETFGNLRLIIAPHETEVQRINDILGRFAGLGTVRVLSAPGAASARTLVIDRAGLLSRLYRFGDIAYIGGGFGAGIHNTLEAATWGVPVLFGPAHRKFREAAGLIESGGGRSFRTIQGLRDAARDWIAEPEARQSAGKAAAAYVSDHAGASRIILDHPSIP